MTVPYCSRVEIVRRGGIVGGSARLYNLPASEVVVAIIRASMLPDAPAECVVLVLADERLAFVEGSVVVGIVEQPDKGSFNSPNVPGC